MGAAGGDSVLLLDTEHALAPGALAEMRYPSCVRGDVMAVAARVVWDSWPGFVVRLGDWRDAEDVRRNPFIGQLDVGQFVPRWWETPALCLTSALISKAALRAIGYPDPGYSLERMGLEWCDRARLHGGHVLAATQALVFGPWPAPIDLAQETCDKLRFAQRNFDRGQARRLRVAYRREDRLRSKHGQAAAREGWDAYGRQRASQQERRSGAIRGERPPRLAASGDGPMVHEGSPVLTVDIVRAAAHRYAAVDPRPPRSRIVLVGPDTPRRRWLTGALAPVCELTCVSTREGEDAVRSLCESADGVIASLQAVRRCGFLQSWPGPVLVDVAQTAIVTNADAGSGGDDRAVLHGVIGRPQDLWLTGVDGLICATNEQRLYWMGQLAAQGRLDASAVEGDEAIERRVAVVPTRIEAPESLPDRILTGVHPRIGTDDRVILWYGGFRPSDDPLTAIRAFDRLRRTGPGSLLDARRLKLVFLAFEEEETDADRQERAAELAVDLGLDSVVFFLDHVPARLRSAYLAEADLGVLLCHDVVESQLREPEAIAACMAGRLPMVVSASCGGSGWIQHYGLGRVVLHGDDAAASQAMLALLDTPRPAYAKRFQAADRALSQMAGAVQAFGSEPRVALDRQVRLATGRISHSGTPPPTPAWQLPRKLWRAVRDEGLQGAGRQVAQYLAWIARR